MNELAFVWVSKAKLSLWQTIILELWNNRTLFTRSKVQGTILIRAMDFNWKDIQCNGCTWGEQAKDEDALCRSARGVSLVATGLWSCGYSCLDSCRGLLVFTVLHWKPHTWLEWTGHCKAVKYSWVGEVGTNMVEVIWDRTWRRDSGDPWRTRNTISQISMYMDTWMKDSKGLMALVRGRRN